MEIGELLAENTVFKYLDNHERDSLAGLAVSRTYTKGTWIVHHGEVWPYLFIVESGAVNAVKESGEGRSLIVISFGPGEIFWGVAFFMDEMPTPVGLVAGDDCRIYQWPQKRLLPSLTENGRFTWELARMMVKRMVYASEILEEMAFQPVTSRLARLLLEHYGNAVGGYVERDLTLDEMAARIGTTREMVCRQLYKFAEGGSIEIKRTEFMITDRDELEQIAYH